MLDVVAAVVLAFDALARWSLISSSSSSDSSECEFRGELESWDDLKALLVIPETGGSGKLLWVAGRILIIRLDELATIMSVTWSRVLPRTSIPFTSRTSSLTASKPVPSARPPGKSREIKIPGTFSNPWGVTRTDIPSRM